MKSNAPILAAILAFCPAIAYADCTPAIPTGLKVVHKGPDCAVELSWNAVVAKAGCPDNITYLLAKAIGGKPSYYTLVTGTDSRYVPQKNVPGTFAVLARAGNLDSPLSAPVAFTCSGDAPPQPCSPEAPTGLKLFHTGPGCSVDLSWNAVAATKPGCPGSVSYSLAQSENGGPPLVYRNEGATRIFTFPTKKNVPTSFQVFAQRGALAGAKSAPVTFTCNKDLAQDACIPEVPTGFTVVNDGTFCDVTLKWNPIAQKPGCSRNLVYSVTTTANGGPPVANGWSAQTTKFYMTQKDVLHTFQVQAGRDLMNGPLSTKLAFKCDRERIRWSPDQNERLHAPCLNGTAPCGRYLDSCQGPRVDKGVLSANCANKAMKLTTLTLPVPCKGMIDYDRATERLICVPQ